MKRIQALDYFKTPYVDINLFRPQSFFLMYFYFKTPYVDINLKWFRLFVMYDFISKHHMLILIRMADQKI